MKWTSDDVKFVEKAIEVRNKGYYIDGRQLTEVYNRVLEKRANPTNCGSCIRQRINELEGALNSFKRLSEKLNDNKVEDNSPVENKTVTDKSKEEMKARMEKVRAARKNNQK